MTIVSKREKREKSSQLRNQVIICLLLHCEGGYVSTRGCNARSKTLQYFHLYPSYDQIVILFWKCKWVNDILPDKEGDTPAKASLPITSATRGKKGPIK